MCVCVNNNNQSTYSFDLVAVIRPSSRHPHTRQLKKSDPVSRFDFNYQMIVMTYCVFNMLYMYMLCPLFNYHTCIWYIRHNFISHYRPVILTFQSDFQISPI